MINPIYSTGGPRGYAHSCLVGIKARIWTLLLIAFPMACIAAAPVPQQPPNDTGYRLAGVMLVGKDRIGFLEVPAGGQVLVRQGSAIGGGKVTVFDEQEMRIVFPNHTIVLKLEGGAGAAVNPAPTGVITSQEDMGHIMVRKVDTGQMIDALDTMQAPGASAVGTARRSDADVELAQRFAAVAHLPPDARIVAVNEQPVDSAEKAIGIVEKSLEIGQSITLTLAARPGEPEGRVYLSLQRD